MWEDEFGLQKSAAAGKRPMPGKSDAASNRFGKWWRNWEARKSNKSQKHKNTKAEIDEDQGEQEQDADLTANGVRIHADQEVSRANKAMESRSNKRTGKRERKRGEGEEEKEEKEEGAKKEIKRWDERSKLSNWRRTRIECWQSWSKWNGRTSAEERTTQDFGIKKWSTIHQKVEWNEFSKMIAYRQRRKR